MRKEFYNQFFLRPSSFYIRLHIYSVRYSHLCILYLFFSFFSQLSYAFDDHNSNHEHPMCKNYWVKMRKRKHILVCRYKSCYVRQTLNLKKNSKYFLGREFNKFSTRGLGKKKSWSQTLRREFRF